MLYTVQKLISNSLYLSGIVAKDYEVPTASQIDDGFNLLNDFLSLQTIDKRAIPYFKALTFATVAGQEKYFLDNVISVETLTFNIGTVRYAMKQVNRDQYFGQSRANVLGALPVTFHVERTFEGSDVYLYFIPNQVFQMNLFGKFGLTEAPSLNFDLSTIYDRYYIAYLRYALAEFICADNSIELQPEAAQKLAELQQNMKDVSPLDLTIFKRSTLSNGTGINWGDVNLGRGWRGP